MSDIEKAVDEILENLGSAYNNVYPDRQAHKEAKLALTELVAKADDRGHSVGFKNGKWAMVKRVNDLWMTVLKDIPMPQRIAYKEAIEAALSSNKQGGSDE